MQLNVKRGETLARWSSELLSAARRQACRCGPAGKLFRDQRKGFVLIGNLHDMEAVAAMRIFALAMSHVSQQYRETIDLFCCSMLPEAQVLMLAKQGLPMIIMLSEGVLTCPLVQRACACRTSQLIEHGVGSSNWAVSESSLIIFADRLDFEYPDAACYHDIRRNFLDHLEQSATGLPTPHPAGLPTPHPAGAVLSGISWKNLELNYCSKEDCAQGLVTFYRSLFNQLALPLSTHASWRTMVHQVESIYERSKGLSLVSHLPTTPSLRSDESRVTTWDCPTNESMSPSVHRSQSLPSLNSWWNRQTHDTI